MDEEEDFSFVDFFEEGEFLCADFFDEEEEVEEDADDEVSDSETGEEESVEKFLREYGDFSDLCRKVIMLVRLRFIFLTKLR